MSSNKKLQPKLKKLTLSPPQNTSEVPDKYTKTQPAFTEGGAPNQVFHIKVFGLSYGTDDKTHAASMCLSLIMLFIVILCLAVGSFIDNRDWIEQILGFIAPAFLVTIGVAIGKSVSDK